jgi:hypothetical protein
LLDSGQNPSCHGFGWHMQEKHERIRAESASFVALSILEERLKRVRRFTRQTAISATTAMSLEFGLKAIVRGYGKELTRLRKIVKEANGVLDQERTGSIT